MGLKILNTQQAAQIYSSLLVHDFPADECKPLERILDAMAEGNYRCIGIYEEAELRGYAFFVTLTQDGRQEILLDYFAVVREYRSSGIGSRFLREVPALFPDAGAVLIEAETPEAAASPEEKTLRERRIRFYERCGCTDTGVRARAFEADFVLLQLPVTASYPPDEVRRVYAAVYQKILPASLYHANIEID